MAKVEYTHAGERVRLLVHGQSVYSLVGRVSAVKPSTVRLETEESSRVLDIPASAVVSAEVEVLIDGVATWTRGELPPTLSSLLAPFSTIFLTGSGALPRDYTVEQLTLAIERCDWVDRALIDASKRDIVDQLRNSLASFIRAREADEFDKAQRAKQGAIDAASAVQAAQEDGVEPLVEAAGHLKRLIDQFWRDYTQKFDPRPRHVPERQVPRVSVGPTGEAELPLRIRLDSSLAPASDISVIFDGSEHIAHLAEAPAMTILRPGEIRTMRLPVVLTHTLAVEASRIKLRMQMRYRTPGGAVQSSPKQVVEYDLVPESQFERIPNPYLTYAGGTAVADPKMFFGRAELIADLTQRMRSGPLGTGYALYGQKRSGKTSLVEQIRSRCASAPVIVVYLSFGLLDRSQLTASFARALLDRIRLEVLSRLEGDASGQYMSRLWPSDERVDSRPIESLQSALIAGRALLSRQPGWAGTRYVFLFDEFTYLFEVLRSADYSREAREDVREFMRQWKALLESRVFSSIVVGQDTMPLFMQRFPNEFSSMTPIRLSYLDDSETRSLADKPIAREDGASRYTGYALESIFEFTAGHPYFSQVLCDRLVQLVNERRRSEIAEIDVADAVESLVEGPGRLDPFRFDCLLTADNTGLVSLREEAGVTTEVHDPSADYPYAILSKVAQLSGPGHRYVDSDEVIDGSDDALVIEDLVAREVLERRAGARVRVRMPLFAEYLRRTI